MLLDLSKDLNRFKLTSADVGRTVYIGMTGKATMCSGKRRQCGLCGKFSKSNHIDSGCCNRFTAGSSFRQLGRVVQVRLTAQEVWTHIDGYIEHSIYKPATI